MKSKNEKTLKILEAVVTVVIGYVLMLLCNYVKKQLIGGRSLNIYLNSFLSELLSAIVMILIVVILKKTAAFRFSAKECVKGLKYGIVPIAISALLAFTSLTDFTEGHELIRGWEIMLVLAQCILIGLSEEALYRGAVLGLLTDAFGDDSKEKQTGAIVMTSVLFGATHLMNAISPEISMTTAVIQAVVAGFMGLVFGAIFFKTGRSIWAGVLIHAIIDAASFISLGTFWGVSENAAIGSLSPTSLVNCILYLVLFRFIMNDGERIHDEEDSKKRNKLLWILVGGTLVFLLIIFVVIPLVLSMTMEL